MLLEHTYSGGTHTYTFMSPVITNDTLLTREVNKLVITINVQSNAEEIGFDEYTVENFTTVNAVIRNVTATTIRPDLATSGTLSDQQYDILNNIRQNLLRLNNELYYKNVENTSADKWVYVSSGTTGVIKYITIKPSTKEWVLTTQNINGGGFNPVDPVTDNGQILVGSTDGTYSWSTQTIQELWDTANGANTTANNNTNSITALEARVAALENIGNAEEGSY